MDVESKVVQSDFVRQVAEALFNEQFAANWRFYVMVGGITLLANIAWHVFAPYLKKHGETLATRADMAEILRQISETTRVTEQVRAAVSQTEWITREWRTIRRLKLEELITAGYSLEQWIRSAIDVWVEGKDITLGELPTEQMKLIATLYYPELIGEVGVVRAIFLKIEALILRHANSINTVKGNKDSEAYNAAINAYEQEFGPAYEALLLAMEDLETKASLQMAKFANV